MERKIPPAKDTELNKEQLRLAARLIDDSSASIYVCDAENYELMYVNQRCASMCGKTVAEARGMTCYSYLKGQDKPCVPCYMETSSEEEFTVREYSSPSGKHYMTRGKFIYWNGKKALVEYLTDETERINARRTLEASLSALEMISKNTGISFWDYDIDERVMTWENYRGTSHMGYPTVISNLPDSMIESGEVFPEDEQEFRRIYKEMADDAESSECTIRLLDHITGKYKWHRIIYTRLHDSGYTSRHAIGFSENVELQQEIRLRYEHELQLRHQMVKNSDNYYQVNLTTRMIEEYHSNFDNTPAISKPTPSGKAFREELLERIADEDREAVASAFFIEGLIESYRSGKNTVTLDYRRKLPDGRLKWLRGTAMIMEKPNSDEIVAFVYCNSIDEEKKDQLALDSIIGEEIESTCLVDVKSGMAHLLKINDGLKQMGEGQLFRYEDISQLIIRSDVLEEDRDNCAPFLSLNNLMEALEQTPTVLCTYRTMDKNGRILRKNNKAFYLDDTRENIVISRRDITSQYEAEVRNESIKKSEELLRLVVEHSARVIYRYNIETREAVSIEPKASESMGLPAYIPDMPESLIEDGTIVPEDTEYVRKLFATARRHNPSDSMRFRIRSKNGAIRWLDVKYTFITTDNEPIAAVISCLDVTEQHEREIAYARYLQSTDMSQIDDALYFEADITADLVEQQGGNMLPEGMNTVGRSYTEVIEDMLKYNFIDSNRETGRSFLSRDHLLTLYSDGHREISKDWQVLFSDGQLHWVHETLQMVEDPFTNHIKVFALLKDITEEKQSSLDMKMRAELDGMTGLYNRTTAETLIKQRLVLHENSACALLVIDLDNLKKINDSLGHDCGDKAIKHIAEVLRKQFRKTDIVGRIGGDEFVVFLDGGINENNLRSILTTFMRRISAIHIEDIKDLPLGASVGAVISATGRETYEELFKKADRALYQVKRGGRANYGIYTPDMEQASYQYNQPDEKNFWHSNSLGNEALSHLLSAISAMYPMVISVNLTQNSYYMMQYDNYTTTKCLHSGSFDDLIAEGVQTFHPEDRESFLAAFSRASLLAAYARGEKYVHHEGRQLGDDNVYHPVTTDVIFVKDENSGDIMEITLAREKII